MKIEAWDAALKSVEHVLRCQTDNVKAIYRKAKVVNQLCDAPEIPLTTSIKCSDFGCYGEN